MSERLKSFLLSNTGLWILFIAWSLFVSNLWLPRNWGFYGTDDWDLTYSTFEVARKSLAEYGQWPHFNPYLAFGSDLDANPQATHASIFFIPVYLFGTFYGYKLAILMAMIIGCWGCMKLFSLLNRDKLVNLCATLIFAGSAYFSRHIFEAGHSNVLYFYFVPWLFYHLQLFRQDRRTRNGVWAVLILFQMISGGAPFVFIASVVLICLWLAGLFWIEKAGVSVLVKFALVITFGVGLSLWKIFPVLNFWHTNPRLVMDDSGINPLIWLQALCDFPTDTRTPHQWHEFAMGLSLVVIAIIIYQISEIRQWKKWIVLLLVVIWISMGNIPPYVNPWYALHHYFPVFDSLRAPYRFGILVVFVLVVSLVKSLHNFDYKRLIYFILIGITLTQAISFNAISHKIIFSPQIGDLQASIPDDRTGQTPVKLDAGLKQQYVAVKNDYFVLNAYEPLHLDLVRDSMHEFVTGAAALFSPNKIALMAKDSTIKLCMRYSDNWHISGQGRLMNERGLLTIEDASGRIMLYYENPDTRKGLLMSIWALGILIISCSLYERFGKR